MNTFEIEVREILSIKINVEAENQSDAILKVKEMYKKQEIILDTEDYKVTEIMPFVDNSHIQEIIENYSDDDDKLVLERILCFIGIPENKSSLIAVEVGSSQCVVNEDYLIDIGIPDYLISIAMNYINMFYRNEFN